MMQLHEAGFMQDEVVISQKSMYLVRQLKWKKKT